MLLHLKQEGLQFTGKTALVDRVLLGKTEFLYIRGSFFTVKTDPEIGPGIIRIGFIVGATFGIRKSPVRRLGGKCGFRW